MPTPQTTITRSLLTITLTIGLLTLAGFGCNGPKSDEPTPRWTPAQQQLIDAWPTTQEGILKNLRASVEAMNTFAPDRVVIGQIALTKDVPASEVIGWFKQFPSSSFVTFYIRAGKIGGGFYNFDPEAPANDGMVQEFKNSHVQAVASAKNELEQIKKDCLDGDTLCSTSLPRAQEAYDVELARTEEYVVGLDIRGPARDLRKLIDDPRVFSINIDSGMRPSGIPFYPSIKDVTRWIP
jgi:hypothetical protein